MNRIMKEVVLEIAYSCNAECLFCCNPWRNPKGAPYPQGEVLDKKGFCIVIDKLRDWGTKTIIFSGGEPLLNPDVFEIAAYSKEQGLRNALLTNGMLVERFSKEIGENFEMVQISLHGTEKTHDMLTGIKGSFHRAINGKKTLEDCAASITANIIVNRLNLPDLKETMAIASSLNVNSVLLNRFLPGGRGLIKASSLSLVEKELVEMMNVAEDACEEFGLPVRMGTPTPPCLKGLRSYKFMVKEGCTAGNGIRCTIDPSGGLRVCDQSPKVLGDCLESDPKKIYETANYVKGFRELQYVPEMCKGCLKLERCRGGCREAAHILLGDINGPDPVFALK